MCYEYIISIFLLMIAEYKLPPSHNLRISPLQLIQDWQLSSAPIKNSELSLYEYQKIKIHFLFGIPFGTDASHQVVQNTLLSQTTDATRQKTITKQGIGRDLIQIKIYIKISKHNFQNGKIIIQANIKGTCAKIFNTSFNEGNSESSYICRRFKLLIAKVDGKLDNVPHAI